MTTLPISIRPIAPVDEPRWRELFRAYRDFYKLTPDEAVVTRAWGWFQDPEHECNALVAVRGDELVGFAHHRPFSSPYMASTGLFLDDLFTDPAARGAGVGRALIAELTAMAAAHGHAVVQWVTAADNHQAQTLYNKVATRTEWVTYEAQPDQA